MTAANERWAQVQALCPPVFILIALSLHVWLAGRCYASTTLLGRFRYRYARGNSLCFVGLLIEPLLAASPVCPLWSQRLWHGLCVAAATIITLFFMIRNSEVALDEALGSESPQRARLEQELKCCKWLGIVFNLGYVISQPLSVLSEAFRTARFFFTAAMWVGFPVLHGSLFYAFGEAAADPKATLLMRRYLLMRQRESLYFFLGLMLFILVLCLMGTVPTSLRISDLLNNILLPFMALICLWSPIALFQLSLQLQQQQIDRAASLDRRGRPAVEAGDGHGGGRHHRAVRRAARANPSAERGPGQQLPGTPAVARTEALAPAHTSHAALSSWRARSARG